MSRGRAGGGGAFLERARGSLLPAARHRSRGEAFERPLGTVQPAYSRALAVSRQASQVSLLDLIVLVPAEAIIWDFHVFCPLRISIISVTEISTENHKQIEFG
jgi:hypothetical protein